MHDSHPSGMPHVDGTLGLGQRLPAWASTPTPVATPAESADQHQLLNSLAVLVAHIEALVDAMPSNIQFPYGYQVEVDRGAGRVVPLSIRPLSIRKA